MNINFSAATVQVKTKKLETARENLKKHFVQLDEVIDDIINGIRSWYLFPHIQKRPTVINLVGMTGTGKTDLILRLKDELEVKDFTKFDMGENEVEALSERDTIFSFSIKRVFVKAFKFINGGSPIICFDEFQFANMLNEKGEEKDNKQNYRVIWELLDSGKFSYVEFNNRWDMEEAIERIEWLKTLKKLGVEVTKGSIKRGLQYVINLAVSEMNGYTEKKKPSVQLFSTKSFLSPFFALSGIEYGSWKELKEAAKQTNNIQEFIDFLLEIIGAACKTETMDLSRSLIFTSMNLDEAFYMADTINPDISADEMARRVKDINVIDLKEALGERFRNEQIARMGNFFVKYPCLDNAGFMTIIHRQLMGIADDAKERFGLTVEFDATVHEIIYKESVFPTQGVRPLQRSIDQMIDGVLFEGVSSMLRGEYDCDSIFWKVAHVSYGSFFLLYFKKGDATVFLHESQILLKIESLRKSTADNEQALVAVHEAGHAVVHYLSTGGIPPKNIVSRTASAGMGGFVEFNFPEKIQSRNLVAAKSATMLGGICAEELVFGEENVSIGSGTDIKMATSLVKSVIAEQGMGEYKAWYVSIGGVDEERINDYDFKMNDLVKGWLSIAEGKAKDFISQNLEFLLQVANYLTHNSSMSKTKFMEFAKKYSNIKEELLPENYFNPRTILEQKLNDLKITEI